MSTFSGRSAYTTRSTAHVTTTVDHPRLEKTDAESIRIFLRLYDQYCNEVTARARQLSTDQGVSTEAVRPVNIMFCVDPEFLESATVLGFIDGADTVEDLTDEMLRDYLDDQAQEAEETVSLATLGTIVDEELRMDMSDRSARSRMQGLFMSYHKLLRRHGLSWVLKANEKTAVYHVLSAIRPYSLKDRLTDDLDFAKHKLRKDFKGFMAHAIKLSEAFQLVDNGPKKDRKKNHVDNKPTKGTDTSSRRGWAGPGSSSNSNNYNKTGRDKPNGANRSAPPCPFGPCKKEGLRHWIADCDRSTDAEKKTMKAEISAAKAADGPHRGTRSHSSREAATTGSGYKSATSRRIAKTTKTPRHDCSMTVTDGTKSIDATGRCDDGSDESIVSPKLVERAMSNGLGKIKQIAPTWMQVSLRSGKQAERFSFSRTWTAPRTVLHLSSGPLALVNITYLVADDDLACEDLLIGRPVLKTLQIDSETMLERNRAVLDGADCSHVGNPIAHKQGGTVSRLMVARLNRIGNFETITEDDATAEQPRVNYYECRNEKDPFPDPSLLDPVDSVQHAHIREAVQRMSKAAAGNGMPQQDVATLEQLISDHMDIFRISLSSGPAAAVDPLRIDLKSDARPVRVRLRNYSKEQREFLEDFVTKLVHHGMAYSNPTAKWASAPLIVPKPGPSRFRFTVDLRPVNNFTVRHHYPMPNLEQELTKLGSSKWYATFDLSHGYWQFGLHPDSQECQSFVTPDGIFTPTRVLHGTTNAVTYLQSTLAEIIPPELRSSILFWLDDILLHSPTVTGLLAAIKTLFGLCHSRNIRLHPDKCVLFASEIRWCGRMISSKGIRFDPRRMSALLEMEEPSNGAHLQQFICALQWVRTAIPNFTAIVTPLHKFMERVYDQAGKRTKRAVARYSLSDNGWGKTESDAFDTCKKVLAKQVTLSHRDDDKRLCIYTDASEYVWSGIATQVPMADLDKPQADQRHEPLAFLSGRFNKTEMGWPIIEKEAYAVIATLDRLHWIAATQSGFDLYTDHRNLIFLFDPLSVVPDLSQTSIRKVLRWAVRLSIYNYTCVHIKGTDNVWADLLGRWSAAPTVRRIVHIPELPSSSDSAFNWPSSDTIYVEQTAHCSARPDNLTLKDKLWRNENDAVWIPDESSDLHLRLCIIAHTGPSGHRGQDTTEKILRASFFWSTMTVDIRSFVRACIHCLSTTGGGKVPRPFGPATHGTKPNDLVQFDYLEIGPSKTGEKYLLLLRDDHSDYKWFFVFHDTLAENAAHALIDWAAAFNVPNGLMSDGPTHFKNETVRLVSRGLKTPHHFTLPYTPWSNGAVERLGKEVLKVFRALVSELRMDLTEWTSLVPIVQSALNNSPSPQRGGVAPVTAFTGMKAQTPIATFMRASTGLPVTLTDAQRDRALNIAALHREVGELHPMVQQTVRTNRARHRDSASRGKLANFEEGDYVLVAREDFHAGEKLALRWRGPRRIIKTLSDYVYQVEDLRNGQVEDIHACRLKYYRDNSLDQVAIMPHVLQSETGMPVARLMRLVDDPDGLKVQVRWRGLPTSEDTLEPFERVFEDVPDMVMRLLRRKNTPASLVTKARRALDLMEGGV